MSCIQSLFRAFNVWKLKVCQTTDQPPPPWFEVGHEHNISCLHLYTHTHKYTYIYTYKQSHIHMCANSFCCLLSQNGFLWCDHIKCVWEGAASTVSLCHMRRWMRETPLRAGECIRKGEKKILGWGVYQPCFFSLGIWAFDMLRMERWPAIKRQTAECHGNYCSAVVDCTC